MTRRLLALGALAGVLALGAGPASASDLGARPEGPSAAAYLDGPPVLVHVRVEGKTTTLFGATEPRALAASPLDALEAASRAGELYYHVSVTGFGPYVDQIGRYAASGTTGWVFKVNEVSPPVGADKLELRPGDRVLWYYADFASGSGPKTLQLSRAGKQSCYRAVAYDDAGNASFPEGVVLHVDGRLVKTQGATQAAVACVGRHRGLVKATAPAMVRSNALP